MAPAVTRPPTRIIAPATCSKGFSGNEDPTWLGIGFGASDLGGLLLIIALVLGGVGLSRARRGSGDRLLRASGVIALVLVAIYVVAIWAMGAKPA